MHQHRIIITGPVGAGKTTAIKTISDIPPITTDVTSTAGSKKNNAQTTVAMDYGTMSAGICDKFHFYGTPGQERFEFMWDILTAGGMGLILLLDNTRTNPFQDMHFFLNAFEQYITDTKVVIGVTQMDINNTPNLEDYHKQLIGFKEKPKVYSTDARVKKDVLKLVQALFIR